MFVPAVVRARDARRLAQTGTEVVRRGTVAGPAEDTAGSSDARIVAYPSARRAGQSRIQPSLHGRTVVGRGTVTGQVRGTCRGHARSL